MRFDLSEGIALALAFEDRRLLELSDRTQHGQQEGVHWINMDLISRASVSHPMEAQSFVSTVMVTYPNCP